MRLFWSKSNPAVVRTVLAVGLLSLFSSVTNLLPLSASLTGLLPLGACLFLRRRTQPVLALSVLVMLLYFSLSALLYAPESFVSPGFYRRDGNVLVTYAPLLILPLLQVHVDVDRIARAFLYFSTALNGAGLVVYAATGGTIFLYEEGIYHFLFQAHNAAGGFLAVLSGLSVGYYLGTRERRFILVTLINVAGLIASHSRGSILAFVVALTVQVVLGTRFARLAVALLVVSQLALISWFYSLASKVAFPNAAEVVVALPWLEGVSRKETIIERGLELWPRAVDLFISSPLCGAGFGSFNDVPHRLEGIPNVCQFNRPAEVVFNAAHAHHSFLHVAAETGLPGVALVLLVLMQIRRFVLAIPLTGLRYGLHVVLWVHVLSSLTEHRLVTPSQMLPFTIILGLAAATRRAWSATEERATEREDGGSVGRSNGFARSPRAPGGAVS
jgi:O-antigen ligase